MFARLPKSPFLKGAKPAKIFAFLLFVLVCEVAPCWGSAVDLPFGKFTKVETPVLSPSPEGLGKAAVFNPAVVFKDGKFYMFYRAQDRFFSTSKICLAVSEDGINFKRVGVVLEPTEPYETPGGCEDPRIVKVGDTWYMTYTAYDGKVARLCLARSRDLFKWEKLGPMFPDWPLSGGWCKSGAILPVKVNGRYVMYFGDLLMWVAYSEDMVHWKTDISWIALAPRGGYFDSKLVEPGPPPILTEKGILLVYNAADEDLTYRVGWVLFSKDDPRKVVARCTEPLLSPTLPYEKYGQVPNVVFATALLKKGRNWYLYYGAADTYVMLAKAPAKGGEK